jgi:superfamily II DNA or RNA helicase
LADEGLDVPTLTAVHMVAPARAAARVEQRVGRIMRPAPGKVQPVIYDYVDNDSLMQSQWRSRAKVYRMLGVTGFQTVEVG